MKKQSHRELGQTPTEPGGGTQGPGNGPPGTGLSQPPTAPQPIVSQYQINRPPGHLGSGKYFLIFILDIYFIEIVRILSLINLFSLLPTPPKAEGLITEKWQRCKHQN